MADTPAAKSSSTVTVGCKLPNGLRLNIYGEQKAFDKSPPVVATHLLKGANASEIVGGHGLTIGVPRDLFEKWLAQNKDSDVVRNGLVFAHERAENTIAEATEKRDSKTGLEGIDTKKLPKGIEQAAAVE